VWYLTLWSRVIPEKVITPTLVDIFFVSYWTWSLAVPYTKCHYWALKPVTTSPHMLCVAALLNFPHLILLDTQFNISYNSNTNIGKRRKISSFDCGPRITFSATGTLKILQDKNWQIFPVPWDKWERKSFSRSNRLPSKYVLLKVMLGMWVRREIT
jgi:hypothetical protein